MTSLAQASLGRVKGNLPTFPGGGLREQLINARAQVHTILRQYVPDLKFDTNQARDVMAQVNAWVERNRGDLEQAMASQAKTLPEFLALNMGSAERVQQWVIANYTIAAAGLGPWESGRVDSLALDPSSNVSQNWAVDDGQTRLNVFAMLVKMETDGEMAFIFRGPPQTGTEGFGALLPVWAIIVVLISIAAIVAYFYLESRKLEVNNSLMRDICDEAQKQGDTATVEKCIEATRDLQISDPWQKVVTEAGKVALILGAGYLAFRYGLPWVADRLKRKRFA